MGVMDSPARIPLFIIAAAVVVTGLYWFRDVLTPFALAVFLWLIIDAFARRVHETVSFIPRWFALPIAILVTLGALAAVVVVIVDSATGFAENASVYDQRIARAIQEIYALVGLSDPPTLSQLFERAGPGRFLSEIAQAFQGIISNAVFVLIYVGFLFAAQASFPRKMDALFQDEESRARASDVVESIRHSIEKYLLVQTVVSVITSVLSYVTLAALGLDNALFWAFVIFLLNYVPTIGSIVATILPTLFALVQFDSYWMPLAVFAGVGVWQFTIGNFLQPRMQGQSLNLSTLVVLLSLAIWGAIWGIAGMFLAAPLTVMVMIIFAQFPSTRPIAVILSADGEPVHKKNRAPTPSM